MKRKHSQLERWWRVLPLVVGFLLAGAVGLLANTHFKDKSVHWVSHNPSYDEPWFVVNLMIYDNDSHDSFFKHDKEDGSHEGPAVYVDGKYVGSPDYELAWPGTFDNGNYDGLEGQRKYDEWWGSSYSNDMATIRFYNPYREEHNKGYFMRVKMYVFLKQWEVGKTHKVKVRGKWKINDVSTDWEEVTIESKAFGNPFGNPTAEMTDYHTVSVKGSLPGKNAATTVGIYTQSSKAPGSYLSDEGMFAKSQRYAQSVSSYSGLTAKLERSDNKDDAFYANYKDAVNLPMQYSATLSPADFKDKDGKKQSSVVFAWFNVAVPGFLQAKNASYSQTNQWTREGTVSWEAVETDGSNRTLSQNGTWSIRNANKDQVLASGLTTKTRSATIKQDGYKESEKIEVYFVPTDLKTLRSELSASTTAMVTPAWAFGDVNAKEVNGSIQLTWSHNPIEDATGSKPYTLYIQRSTDYAEGKTDVTWTDIETMTIASKSIIDGSYTDPGSGLEANTTYHYRLKVNIFGEDQICPVTTAMLSGSKIESFAASRGTYSNMVKLQWNVKQVGATICNFVIYRRPLGSGDEVNWRAIYTTSGTVTSYSYEDVTALPGSFNEYKLVLWTQNGEERSVNDAMMTDGFSVATGIISGNISYGTGTAVDGAKVTLNQQNAEGELTSGLRSVKMEGFGAGFRYDCDTKTLNELFGGDFSIQMYINPDSTIMQTHDGRYLLLDVYKAFTLYLRYDNTQQKYTTGVYISGSYYETALTLTPNAWTHLSCVHSKTDGQTILYAVTEEGIKSVTLTNKDGSAANVSPTIRNDDTCISIGNEASFKGEMYFNGYMDEFRFWTKALSEKDIERNYNHPLSGSETALAIYYPFDEGLTSQIIAYDFSRMDGISNNRHASALTPAASSTQLPGEDMMSLMAYTDTNGYYEVRGVPFSGEGTSYSITPTLGIHEFSPTTRSRFVSISSLTHSGVDFEDVSSFPVSGKVFYAGTDYPVEGANFYVDGTICSKDGQVIETNDQGEFTISVPIGDHFITVAKSGHVFANGGRYPTDPDGVGTRVTFNKEIKNMEFIDSTLVNFTGRVAGGSIEGNKQVGFGLSTNNIGVTEFVLTPTNPTPRLNVKKEVTETSYSYETNDMTVDVSSATDDIESKSWRGAGADDCHKIFIHTDSLTGEFSALVPPLEYMVSAMKVVKTDLEVAGSQYIDLSNPQEQYTDTLHYDDGTYKVYSYNQMLNQVYHSTPTFNVVQNDHRDDGVFGISSYTLSDELGDLVVDDIYSFDETGKPIYKYGGAVFEMYEQYTFEIEAFEEYVNKDGSVPIEFHVPLSDLVVTIDNALSDQQPVYMEDMNVDGTIVKGGQVVELKSNQLVLDSLGCAVYRWTAGLPNITEPYTRTITISYDIEDRTYLWSGSGMEGVILGDMPTGNNFVTAGPDMLDMILRDPPGSKSSASWTSGTVKSKTTTDLTCWSSDDHLTTTSKIGAKCTTGAGMGVVQVSEAESKLDIVVGAKGVFEGESGNSWSHSLEVTKTISTSDDNSFDGACGDIFIGSATNIIIGKSRNVGFHRINGGNEVQLELTDAITTGIEFSTMFNYTQSYIENQLIPNLTALRNGMLTTVSADTINTYVNNGKSPVYLTTLTPDDPNFGADNTDKLDSKGNVMASSSGNSYTMVIPKDTKDSFQDSVMWCNSQIRAWQDYLAQNEREKVKAFENRQDPDSVTVENYSFDSGTSINNSYTVSESNSSKSHTKYMGYAVASGTSGFIFNGFGMIIDIGTESGGGTESEKEEGTTNTATFSYTLAEEGDCDAISVDVYEYGAYGPIFRTRGGQTSAPYEGQTVTKYFEPGTTIMEATMQIEMPDIEVDVPVVSDIPSGSVANYTLRLCNNSEIATELYYRLMQAEDTNPNGAQLFVDGRALTDSRLIMIPPGETVTKILQLKQSDLSILDYDRIGIVLGSESQYQVNFNWDVIADTVFISAHYVPSSSPVTLELSNNIMNTQTGTDLVLTMKDFDRTYRGLKAFRMQYKKQGATDWTLIHEYVLDEANLTANNELLPATGASVSYRLPMAAFSDGDYLFRVVSASTYGADEVLRYSDEIALVKDLQRPTPIGIPEPSDGILDIGDELSVTFNETILKGELTPEANFRVTGVLNGATIDHETALSVSSGLPTGNAAAQTEAAINLSGKDFAFDMWVNLTAGEGTLLSHGSGASKLTIGTDADGHLQVGIGNETYTSENTVPTGKWAFLSLSVSSGLPTESVSSGLPAESVSSGLPAGTASKLTATIADDANETPLFKNQAVTTYNGNGPLSVGCGSVAAIHELLLWDEAHDIATALANRSKTKNPSTRNLIGYWKMDEGEGTTIRDYARNRHMTMAAETWYLNNVNKAINLDGESFLTIDASELPICVDDDYALEFWMRGGQQKNEAQLLQMGEVALSLTADGNLQLQSVASGLPDNSQSVASGLPANSQSVASGLPAGTTNSQFSIPNSQLTDNVWHHVALNVLRQGSAAIYIDGRRCLTTPNANVGSIATNNLIVGARRTLTDEANGTYSYDRPFTGLVDEVRVWNASLSSDVLASNRKVRLTGSEDGLVAYYPFERQTLDEGNQVITVGDATDLTGSGKSAQQFSILNSQSVASGLPANSQSVASGLPAGTPGLSILNYTDDAPALKTKPTETNVSFTFVASDEKVVITINEDATAIEGTTLHFTVRDVSDKNGNYSVPASWSAFVNRKELAWAEDELSLECSTADLSTLTSQLSPLNSLTATIVNKSGTQQMWSLSGIPSWLTASADYGTTNPLQETEVTFTVSPATPIGRYEVAVYLKGNNGIETPLTLYVNVTGPVPDWSVNPNDFENSMNVIARLEMQDGGLQLTDEDDLVAAFIGEECRGVAHPTYMERFDSYFVTMDIYGNDEQGKEVIFRVYDASTGTVYPVVQPSETVIFEPLALVGRYEDPVVLTISDKLEQSTELKAGWNWLSFYVKADDMTPASLLKGIKSDVLAIKSQDSWLMLDNTSGNLVGNMTGELTNVQMYAVKMNAPRTLRIVGDPVNPATTPVTLVKNWNWMGYYGSQVLSLADALAGMNPESGDIVKGITGVSYFSNYEWVGSLLRFEPGAGYMVKVSDAREFSYPAAAVSGAQSSRMGTSQLSVLSPKGEPEGASSHFAPIDYHTYSGNAIMAARLVANGLPVSNTELAIMAEGECRAAAVTNENGIAYLTIPGDEATTMTIMLAVGEEVVQAVETIAFEPDAIFGSPNAPFVIDLGKATGILTIGGQPAIDNCVYDLQGRRVDSSTVDGQSSKTNGQSSILKKGIYIINGEKKVVK